MLNWIKALFAAVPKIIEFGRFILKKRIVENESKIDSEYIDARDDLRDVLPKE